MIFNGVEGLYGSILFSVFVGDRTSGSVCHISCAIHAHGRKERVQLVIVLGVIECKNLDGSNILQLHNF